MGTILLITRFSNSQQSWTVDTKSSHQNYDFPVLEIVLTLHVKSFIKRSSVDPKASVKQITVDNLKCFNIISVNLWDTQQLKTITFSESVKVFDPNLPVRKCFQSLPLYWHNVRELISAYESKSWELGYISKGSIFRYLILSQDNALQQIQA